MVIYDTLQGFYLPLQSQWLFLSQEKWGWEVDEAPRGFDAK